MRLTDATVHVIDRVSDHDAPGRVGADLAQDMEERRRVRLDGLEGAAQRNIERVRQPLEHRAHGRVAVAGDEAGANPCGERITTFRATPLNNAS